MLKSNVQFFIGEVVNVDTTYQLNKNIDKSYDISEYNLNQLFTIEVSYKKTSNITSTVLCKPANLNIKQIPQKGELVLIFNGFNHESYDKKLYRDQWYYLTIVSSLNTINNNYHPFYSLDTNDDENKIVKNIPQRQPYRGDILFEGRFGNSIRLGNTHKQVSETEFISRKWIGHEDGSPIIILSTYKNLDTKDVNFSTEDINTDHSSVYLTSTQNLPEFKLNNTVRTTQSHTDFKQSQLIGTAERVILKSKTDSVILDSQKSIEINSPLLYIGTESDKEPLLHSTAVETMLKRILTILSGGFRDSAGVTCYPILKNLLTDETMTDARKELLNYNIWTDKYKE